MNNYIPQPNEMLGAALANTHSFPGHPASWAKGISALLFLLGCGPSMLHAQVNYAISGNTAYVTASPDAAGDVVVAPTFNSLPVTSIGDQAFMNCTLLTGVAIPDSVTSIGSVAFSSSGLTHLVIPDHVTVIGDYAFESCGSLTNAVIGSGVTNIGTGAFKYSGVVHAAISDSVATLSGSAFEGCGNLIDLVIGKAVTTIGNQALLGTGLTNIVVDAQNPAYSVSNGVLFNKTQTMLVQYPLGSAKADYIVPNGVTDIGGYAFNGSANLKSVIIPDSVTDIEEGAFANASLTNAVIGNGVINIGVVAFAGCPSLANVVIGNSVLYIGVRAFADCPALTSVAVPESVSDIRQAAFDNCPNLLSVNFLGNAPAIAAGAFADDSSATIYSLPGAAG